MSDADDTGPQGPVDDAVATTGGDEPRSDRRVRAIRSGPRGADQPVSQAEPPKFSQPVRQVVLMLIVLGLVCAGGWLAYGRIMSIFSVNPALNGTIFAVFVFGVLTCFWQVAQLVTSVSWIERFASRRRNAAERGIGAVPDGDGGAAPRLLAPLAALLSSGGHGAISTASSRSILESVAARIDESRDITRYVSNLLIFLGLLGTFYGLAITVPAVVETIRALQPQEGESGLEVFDKLMSGLEGQLGGMGTAFSSSLLGLAGSLVVGLLELFATHGQNRFYRELEEWMSGFTRVDLGEGRGDGLDQGAIVGFLDQVAGQMADLHEYYLQRDAQRAVEAEASETRIRVMSQGIDGLTAQLLEQGHAAGQMSEITRQAFLRMAEGQERLAETLLQDSRDAAAQEADTTAPLLERLINGQDRLAETLLQDTQKPAAIDPAPLLVRLIEGQEQLTQTLLADPHRASAPDPAPLLTRLIEGQEQLTQTLLQDSHRPADTMPLLARLVEGQDRMTGQLANTPDTAAALARIAEGQDRLAERLLNHRAADVPDAAPLLARLIEGQDRLIRLTERAPVVEFDPDRPTSEQEQSDVIEARMHLRSIDYQLARLVEEMAAGRADMVGELRNEMAALSRAIRVLGQGDAT